MTDEWLSSESERWDHDKSKSLKTKEEKWNYDSSWVWVGDNWREKTCVAEIKRGKKISCTVNDSISDSNSDNTTSFFIFILLIYFFFQKTQVEKTMSQWLIHVEFKKKIFFFKKRKWQDCNP